MNLDMEVVLEGNVSDIAIIHGLFITALLNQTCTCGPYQTWSVWERREATKFHLN